MRHRALAMLAVAVTASAALVACTGDDACAAPGGGSSGGRSSGGSTSTGGGSTGSKSTGGGSTGNRTPPRVPAVVPGQQAPAGQPAQTAPVGQAVEKVPGAGPADHRTERRDGGSAGAPLVVPDDRDDDDCD